VVASPESNINAVGKYQIDIGKVALTALSGCDADELDGAGLIFGNANNTFFEILDSTAGQPGGVNITGPVTLAANTRLTMNYSGANNTADLLFVRGLLTLNGTLVLNSVENPPQKPTAALDFLGDSVGAINGTFASFDGNVPMPVTYTGRQDPLQPGFYQVTIQ
jgi:hypothetical protein